MTVPEVPNPFELFPFYTVDFGFANFTLRLCVRFLDLFFAEQRGSPLSENITLLISV
jgi:hypothetical protein